MIKDFLVDEDAACAVENAILVAAISALLISTMWQMYKSFFRCGDGAGGQLLEPHQNS